MDVFQVLPVTVNKGRHVLYQSLLTVVFLQANAKFGLLPAKTY